MSVAHCEGNVREFQSVWRVVTLVAMLRCVHCPGTWRWCRAFICRCLCQWIPISSRTLTTTTSWLTSCHETTSIPRGLRLQRRSSTNPHCWLSYSPDSWVTLF